MPIDFFKYDAAKWENIAKERNKNMNNIAIHQLNDDSVNPLPHSLLNFVFDFGHLKEKYEEQYIENMITFKMNDYLLKYFDYH